MKDSNVIHISWCERHTWAFFIWFRNLQRIFIHWIISKICFFLFLNENEFRINMTIRYHIFHFIAPMKAEWSIKKIFYIKTGQIHGLLCCLSELHSKMFINLGLRKGVIWILLTGSEPFTWPFIWTTPRHLKILMNQLTFERRTFWFS